jgi:hypothetical protein
MKETGMDRGLMTAFAAVAAMGLSSTPWDRPGRQMMAFPTKAGASKKRRRKLQQQARRKNRK